MFWQNIGAVLRQKHTDLKARLAKWLVVREVVKQLRVVHAQEMISVPPAERALVRSHQVQEIQAVASGQIDIVDRRSWAYPFLPEALHRLNQPVLKATPYNLRRFSETPVPRRAINLIKNALLMFEWSVEVEDGIDDQDPDVQQRIQIATECLKRPNNIDSFREFMEAVLEDIIIGGYGCMEPRMTPWYQRPFKVWAVQGDTIRIFMDWTESTPDRPRFAQMTGLKGERGIVTFLDDELIYIRDNVRTNTPFGMGKLEVAFQSVNYFLGVQDMSGKAGSDQVHKTWLWWEQTMHPSHLNTIRRQIMNELEGQAKVSLMAGAKKPDALEITPVKPDDLLLDYQKFMIGIIANAFDLSPMALGETDKVNKATGQVMAESDFRSAVLPTAKRVEDSITSHLLHRFMGWKDLRFRWIGLEDPDAITRTMIQQRQYMMDSIVADEVREAANMPPLEGGWGKLTMTQKQILTLAAQAKLGLGKGMGASGGGAGGKGGVGTPGAGAAASGAAGGGSAGALGMGGMGIGNSIFSAWDVAGMQPDEISLYQEMGILPQGAQLPSQMEQQAPGILNQLTDELQSFFQYLQQEDEAEEVQPRPITPQDQEFQEQRFMEEQHEESVAEKMINRRGNFGPAINQQYRKAPERGKYPRSGGRFVDPTVEKVQGDDPVSPFSDPGTGYTPAPGSQKRKKQMATEPKNSTVAKDKRVKVKKTETPLGPQTEPFAKKSTSDIHKSHFRNAGNRKKQPYQ